MARVRRNRRKNFVKKAKGLNRNGKPKTGDVFELVTDVEVADVDGDNVQDVVFVHEVRRNGELFVTNKVTWYGLGEETAAAFVDALADCGIEDDDVVEVRRWRQVVAHWKRLTKALRRINKLGDAYGDELGEDVKPDEVVEED